eukprot:scaffold32459_cov127-Skeletonema_marinoi.AAC.2
MEDRYCVPATVKDQVKDYLTLSEHYSLPKVELSDNDICTTDTRRMRSLVPRNQTSGNGIK